MDNKSSSDTNNNEALRLANHNPSNSHAPSTSGAPPLTKDVAKVMQNGGRDNTSPGPRQTPDIPNETRPQTPAENTRVTPPPDVTTEASTSNRSPDRVQRCNLCGKRCWKQSDFERHLVYHLGRKPFKCSDCGKRFQVKSNMLLHQRAAHGDRYNHEFLECPPGVRSERGEHPMLCQEIYPSDHLAGIGTTPQCLSHEGDAMQLKRDAGNSDGSKSDDSPGSTKGNGHNGSSISPQSNSGNSGGSGDADRLMREEEEEYNLDYPSVFPGLKQQLSVRNETVLVTRLDGVNKSTKEKLSLYKCHMCGKIFNVLSKLQCHLSLHFERTLNVYVCTYCDAHFPFKTQLAQHLSRSHEVAISPRDDILDLTELSPQNDPSQSHLGESVQGEGPETATSTPTSLAYSGYTSSSQTFASAEGKNSGSPRDDRSSGTPLLWSHDDDSMHYSVSARALYSRVNGLYVCQFCNKGFDRLFSLSRHERVHTGFKPCYCKYCGRGFSEPRNLRHHIVRFHSDIGDGHLIKRLRKGMPVNSSWRVNRRVSHSSQRLAYVSPEAMGKSGDLDEGSESSQPLASTEPMTPSRPGSPDKDAPSPHRDVALAPQPIIIEPKSDSNPETPPPLVLTPPSNKELANEIREKEKLDEDVTVVIPSDAPLTDNKDRDATTPKSVCSENTNWSMVSDADMESMGNEIMSAPIKTLMTHHQQMRPRRKMSFTTTTPTPVDDRGAALLGAAPDEQDIKPKMEPPSDPPTSSLTGVYPSPENLLASVSTHLSLPFNPLNISTYMAPGLTGLLPSPLISPLNQAFFAQQGLTSPSMVHNPMSFFSSLANAGQVPTSLIPTQPTNPASQPNPAKDASPLEHPMAPSSAHRHSPSEPEPGAVRGSLDDLQSWMAKGSARGSALSKSTSRSVRNESRLYVVRQPVKREEACKPVVLPDGRTVYRCTYCNKDFCTFSDVNRHMDFHEDIRPYKCKYCDYYARTNSQLKVHMMRHQGIREFHCKLCNYKGVTQSDLNRHMKSQIHMMKAQNECKHCGEGFVSPKNLERHYHEKHFSHYEKMASSHAAAAAAAHAAKLGQGSGGYQGSV